MHLGGLFTLTVKLWFTDSPPGSFAVTVTDALPPASPVYVTLLPETLTLTTLGFDELAVYVSRFPSGSLK